MLISACLFNSGFTWTFQNILEECQVNVSEKSLNLFKQIDITRIKSADLQTSQHRQDYRKKERCKKNKAADAFQKDYKSRGFHMGY